ncbi:MAG: SusC/RagA family TonB-linked outer membrane protein [Bacteroidia bacterium]|nr:SusC/RagA family TonB-linked outer membrane protein [Bacteroidia bacterium]
MNIKQKAKSFSLLLLTMLGIIVSSSLHAQTVSGTVTSNADGSPLAGATVLVEGTTVGAFTDANGKYSLNAGSDANLIFSFVGFARQTIAVGGRTVIDVVMEATESTLEEVVVVGYGTVKKKDLTGAVSSIKAEDFNGGIIIAPDQLVQGKVAGVQIMTNSGQPGGTATFRIRGNASVRSGNQPLFVVDGVPLDGRTARPDVGLSGVGSSPSANPLNFINPNDIESIDVLKDASATAIYGSRGANGVVIITTKKGKAGAPSVSYNASVGVSSILKRLDVLTGDEYRQTLSDYGLTGGNFGGSEDALSAILRNGVTQNYNVSINGGNDQGRYRISTSYLDQQGIVQKSGLKKYTSSFNGTYNFLNDRLTIDMNLLASHNKEQIAPIVNDAGFTGSLIGQALQWFPTKPLRKANGDLDIELGSTTINPLAMLEANDDVANTTTVLGSISPSFKITDKLQYRFLYSINHGTGIRKSQLASWINVQGVEGRGFAGFANNILTTQQFTHTLNFNTAIGSNIDLSAVAGYEYMKFENRGMRVSGQDFLTDEIPYNNILQNSSQSSRQISSFADPTSELQSYFGRANVSIQGKYLFTATVRADGSSKFGENNKYGVFPSFAAAWNLANEDFLSGSPFESLKLRAGWGQTGNQEFPAGAAQERYAFGNNGVFSGLENVANPDLRWETSTTLNIGVDFSIANGRLYGSLDWFNRTTTDLLFNFETTQPAPAGRYWVNLDGEVVNSGLEFLVNAFIISNDNLSWEVGVNGAFLNNILNDYVGPTVLTGALHGQGITGSTVQRLESGQPLNSFYVREWNGIGENGLDDLTDGGNTLFFLGDPNPDMLLGFTTSLTAGKLSVNVNFNGAFGHQIYNNTANTILPIGNLNSGRNIAASLLDVENQEKLANSIKSSSRYLESGDYMKLTNATISYNLGDLFGGYVKGARVFVTGQNLFILTNFTGFDPEINVDKQVNGVPSFGIEYAVYPTARSIIAGVSFSF